MICSKCQKETAGPNFCGHCGTALWEKCPECGQMELIDRKFCNKEREKFWKDWSEAGSEKRLKKFARIVFYYYAAAGTLFIFLLFNKYSINFIATCNLLAILLILFLFLGRYFVFKKEKKIFFEKYPHYEKFRNHC